MTLGAVPCTSPDLNSIKDMIDAQTSSTGGKGPNVWIEGWVTTSPSSPSIEP
jgi:hypothetical protein